MPSLTADARADVCVVGAGIAGLLIAERLQGLGLHVLVIDRGRIGAGETGHTTAHLTEALDDRYARLERLHGTGGAALAADSHRKAIDHLESLALEIAVDCLWQRVDGYLCLGSHSTPEREQMLEEELGAARRAGLLVEPVLSLPERWPCPAGRALRFPRQAQFHPLLFLNGIVARLRARGVRICGNTHATSIEGGEPVRVEVMGGSVIECDHAVVATNTPINNRFAIHTKQSGYQTYVIAFRVPAGLLAPILLWDGPWAGDTSYHYVRVVRDLHAEPPRDLLLVGGEDHKTGQGPDGDGPYRRLEDWARRFFPQCGAIERRWSGEVMEPADGLGFIGRNPTGRDHVYLTTGDSGNGMTHGAIAALVIPDLIAERSNPWAALYDPGRAIGLRALPTYLRENLNTLAQYADWLRPGDVAREQDIPPNTGAVLLEGGGRRTAVYRDGHGHCIRLNATCPHLGGVVRWNAKERSWDCPCHGSRFDLNGKVIHGPANRDLTPESTSDDPAADPTADSNG
jgi:glycine/D-amino acid oxidase-like deaminating enzyme/nitrite reductase/ring-hydroxylating ferredoxin subunit